MKNTLNEGKDASIGIIKELFKRKGDDDYAE